MHPIHTWGAGGGWGGGGWDGQENVEDGNFKSDCELGRSTVTIMTLTEMTRMFQ